MSLTVKRVAAIVFVAYLVLTCYTAYFLISKTSAKSKKEVQRIWSVSGEEEWNPWGEELEQDDQRVPSPIPIEKPKLKWWSNKTLDYGKNFQRLGGAAVANPEYSVEIWGKAAIGLFLWEHILAGKLESKMNGIWRYGFKKIDNVKFKFRTGPGVIPSKVPAATEYVVIVLNGRSDEKIGFARMWLDFLRTLRHLRGAALVILGDEQCENDWLLPYMSSNNGPINATFLVYDSPLVDEESFFQWPLGVAMYRDFPRLDIRRLELEGPRPYACNFLGTVYPNSSRQHMMQVIRDSRLDKQCLVRTRSEWVPAETKESMEAYVSALRLSDLTLSPVGKNTECYRIYEAFSMGSVPIVEDVMTSGKCSNVKTLANGEQEGGGIAVYRGHIEEALPSDVEVQPLDPSLSVKARSWPSSFPPNPSSVAAPLRLLKAYNAPVIWVANWTELPRIIQREPLLSPAEKIRRRREVIAWYDEFKQRLRDYFVKVLKRKFFLDNRR